MDDLILRLPPDEREAVEKLAAEYGCARDVAVRAALRDWLIGNGYLDQHELDEDGEVAGEA